MYTENSERDQDRVFDVFDHYKRFGYIMFKQNRRIYTHISGMFGHSAQRDWTILEAGCGTGQGAYLLKPNLATDVSEGNVKFAKELYPDLNFDVWDIGAHPWKEPYDVVVCVDAIEHTKRYKEAFRNLMDSATRHLIISTPNRRSDNATQPSNPFHVREFYPEEVLEFMGPNTRIHHWDTFEELTPDTSVSPLIYHKRGQ